MSRTITAEYLECLRACFDQVELFRKLYPDGVELPDDPDVLQQLSDEAGRAGLDVGWAARRLGLFPKLGLSVIARCWWNSGGLKDESRIHKGRLHDAPDGTAAYRRWNEREVLVHESHWRQDELHGHLREWNDDGKLLREELWENGKLVEKRV